ncbi:hypothetical protein [Streptomyces marianii]|uniref:Uncharacterized protein n=1 Tax=Streptomyces marianii TaxID=1817406 RepID=A0A5R9EC51_9ACTN|nr:hypothetical protein [Streptomyces marianii]TLQ46362.1 hypothetical protein FEF34_28270 [Streptomyces marianii]
MEDTVWPEWIGLGDRVRFDGRSCTVTEVYGRRLTLTDAFGDVAPVDVAALLVAPGFTMLDQQRPSGEDTSLVTVRTETRARWWQSHIVEVLTGLPPNTPPGTPPRPGYDPALHTLGEREAAKAQELTGQGVPGASARSVRRKRQRYEAMGLAGLVDGRTDRREEIGARWDPRLLSAVRQAARPGADGRRRSVEEVRRRVTRIFEHRTGRQSVDLPSRSTFHRLYAEMESAGLLESAARWPGRQVVLGRVLS